MTRTSQQVLVRNRPSIQVFPRTYDLLGLPSRYFNKGELERLLALYEMVPEIDSVIEFGVNSGRTPLAALRNIGSIKNYYGVDIPPGVATTMDWQKREIPAKAGELVLHDPRFHLILRPRGSFDLTEVDLRPVDAAFIDADHSRLGVLNDYALAKKIVRPGGLIIFHDDNCLPAVEVTQTLNELCENGAEILHVADTWLSFERV